MTQRQVLPASAGTSQGAGVSHQLLKGRTPRWGLRGAERRQSLGEQEGTVIQEKCPL